MEGELESFKQFLQLLKSLKYNGNVSERDKIRNFMLFLQRSDNESIRLNPSRNCDLLKLVLDVLASDLLHQDHQVLLSTTLCLLLKISFEKEICDKILSECITFDKELLVPSSFGTLNSSVVIKNSNIFRICVSWSILQCFGIESLEKFYLSDSSAMADKTVSPFLFIFGLLEEHCNKFTNVTFLSFRMIPVWLNRMEELYTLNLIDEPTLNAHLNKVLYIVCNNWENSISGVREKNVEILRTVFIILSKTSSCEAQNSYLLNLTRFLELIMVEVPWRMKCKYLMFSSLLKNFGVKEGLHKFPNIPRGLVYSLSFPHLVSAGADSYRELIKELTLDQWLNSFYHLLKNVMVGEDRIAISNLMSYWMPDTLKAFPLVISEMLSDLSSAINPSSLFSLVALYRIGRKNGLLKWGEMDYEIVKKCMSHLKEDIRGEAFIAVCVSTKTTLFPTSEEIKMICLFLEENVNIDSAKLRQITITSFKVFVCRIKYVFCLSCNEHESPGGKAVDGVEKILKFFIWLQMFITQNFVPGSNYQRRITSLHLLGIVLDNICLEVGSSSKSKGRKRKEHAQGKQWLKNEIGRGFKGSDIFNILLMCLMDSVADIRDVASDILKRHFETPCEDLFHKLWKKALSMCSSSMFYEIESGAVLADCLIHWRLQQKTDTPKAEVVPFIDVLLSHAEEQKVKLVENVLRGAVSTPVHGILNVLHRLVSCPDNLPHLGLERIQVKRLIAIVESMINFALGVLSSKPDSKLDVAPSFEEMGIAIECTITENAKSLDDVEINGLSGAPELVLNCIWLNLKVCCQIVSALVTNLSLSEWGTLIKESDVEYCGSLLTRVLMKCRHKGAIESAGKSLSSFALFCASRHNPKLKELPLKMLRECLDQIIGKKSGRTSVTRRSAGLSILIQKLITADGKNTIPICVPVLLSWAKMDYQPEFCNAETEDLPQAQALHFLRAIVQDSSVFQYVSPYMNEISLVCFMNFSSEIWAIRNAALQLFGVVVPKLVGQKKGQEEDVVGSSVTVEEINAHYPELLDYMLKELRKSVQSFSQTSDTTSPTLLPILILCSRLTLGIPQMHTQSFTQLLLDFQTQFHQLLSSPNITVRKSCAKAISAFTPLSHLFDKIEALVVNLLEDHTVSENEIHGKLFCIKTLRNRHEIDCYLIEEHKNSTERIQRIIEKISISRKWRNRCYFVRALLCEIQGFTDYDLLDILGTVQDKSCKGFYPGLLLWAAASLECIILTSSDDSICSIIQECFQSNEYLMEVGLHALFERMKKFPVKEQVMHKVFIFLHNICNSCHSNNITMHCLNFMLLLCSKSPVILSLEEIEALFQRFVVSSSYGIGCSSVALSVISSLILSNGENREAKLMAIKVARAVQKQSLPNNLEEIRLQAVKTLTFFLPLIYSKQHTLSSDNIDLISEDIVSSLLNTVIFLLQDENLEVRTEAARFSSRLFMDEMSSTCTEKSFNPNKCINLILTKIILFLPLRKAVNFLWEHLTNTMKPEALIEPNQLQLIRNPFDHGIENVFLENYVITKCSGDSLKSIIRCGKYDFMDIKSFIPVNSLSLLEAASTLLTILSMETIGNKVHTNADIYHTILSMKYQLEIRNLLDTVNTEASQLILSQIERKIKCAESQFC